MYNDTFTVIVTVTVTVTVIVTVTGCDVAVTVTVTVAALVTVPVMVTVTEAFRLAGRVASWMTKWARWRVCPAGSSRGTKGITGSTSSLLTFLCDRLSPYAKSTLGAHSMAEPFTVFLLLHQL